MYIIIFPGFTYLSNVAACAFLHNTFFYLLSFYGRFYSGNCLLCFFFISIIKIREIGIILFTGYNTFGKLP